MERDGNKKWRIWQAEINEAGARVLEREKWEGMETQASRAWGGGSSAGKKWSQSWKTPLVSSAYEDVQLLLLWLNLLCSCWLCLGMPSASEAIWYTSVLERDRTLARLYFHTKLCCHIGWIYKWIIILNKYDYISV